MRIGSGKPLTERLGETMHAVVIRHAERLKFASELGLAGHEADEDAAPITDEGAEAATRVGTRLKGTFDHVFTSPVRRCVETAEYVTQGAELPLDSVRVASFLSSTFFGLLRRVDERTKQDTVRSLLSGQAVAGFEYPRDRCAEALGLLGQTVVEGPTIFVTHDWWMALLLANMTDAFDRHGYTIWPAFLESYEIDFAGRTVRYRGDEYGISTVPKGGWPGGGQ
jgi:broad specificity phosphatase PhoE